MRKTERSNPDSKPYPERLLMLEFGSDVINSGLQGRGRCEGLYHGLISGDARRRENADSAALSKCIELQAKAREGFS